MARTSLAAALVMMLLSADTLAAEPEILADGLHTWRVGNTRHVHSCCLSFRGGKVAGNACRLDGSTMSIATDGDCAAGPGAAQVYVRIADGAPVHIWLLSSSCPVSANVSIEDHDVLSDEDSVAWFRSVIENRRVDQGVREEALFALVQTESDEAFSYLDRLLTGR